LLNETKSDLKLPMSIVLQGQQQQQRLSSRPSQMHAFVEEAGEARRPGQACGAGAAAGATHGTPFSRKMGLSWPAKL
jgi:hypothetical protein